MYGFSRTPTNIPYESLGYCKPKRHFQSVIEYKSDEETRGQQAPACFFFIVKSDIKIFVWSVDENNDFFEKILQILKNWNILIILLSNSIEEQEDTEIF